MGLKELENLDGQPLKHWYYNSKFKAVINILSGVNSAIVLDVGAGSGVFLKELLRARGAREAWLMDPGYDRDIDLIKSSKPIYFRRCVQHSSANLVLMTDVLEHVDDDLESLKSYVDMVPDSTRFLITVPAFQFLWSGHDVFLEHRRRYNLKQIESVLSQSGLSIVKSSYYFAAIFSLACFVNIYQKGIQKLSLQLKSDLRMHSRVVNYMLRKFCSLELPFVKWNKVGGLSIICLAEK